MNSARAVNTSRQRRGPSAWINQAAGAAARGRKIRARSIVQVPEHLTIEIVHMKVLQIARKINKISM
jgi:hypothetical protein